jgi:hypothetical protein
LGVAAIVVLVFNPDQVGLLPLVSFALVRSLQKDTASIPNAVKHPGPKIPF